MYVAEVRRDVFSWLGRDDPNDLYKDSLRRKLNGTCIWVLSCTQFSSWGSQTSVNGDVNLLWIHGPAGFGKTVLCASLIEHLEARLDETVAHFFLSTRYTSKDDPFAALRSWIAQLMSSRDIAYDVVRQKWLDQDNDVATKSEIVVLLQEVVRAIPECTLVLDGLDECTWTSEDLAPAGADTMTGFITAIRQASSNTNARLLLVSRDESRIRSSLQSRFALNEIKISPSDVDADIQLFSTDIVNRRLAKKDETVQNDIIQKMAHRCNGQFLWVRMQESTLKNWKNRQQLEDAIEETPPGLESLYDRNLAAILHLPSRERHRALSILRWTTFAFRPLTIKEMTEAILISGKQRDLPVHLLPDAVDEDYIESELLALS